MKNSITQERTNFYRELDIVVSSIHSFKQLFENSVIIQNYCVDRLYSFVYSTLIMLFFYNLNRKNIIANNLPKGNIGKLKNKFRNEIGTCTNILKLPLHTYDEVSKKDYLEFRSKIQKKYPEFMLLIDEIERTINLEVLKTFLSKNEKRLRKAKKTGTQNVDTEVNTDIIELSIKRKGKLPLTKSDWQKINLIKKQSLNELVSMGEKILQRDSSNKINYERKRSEKFQRNLYSIWKKPLDLLELLIDSSMEIGEREKTKLANGKKHITNPRYVALIKIHARSVHISNEIFSLLRSGYADGANARWRSLYELTVIFLMLKASNDVMSMRYLEHQVLKKFRNLNDYQMYGSKIGYRPVSKKEYTASKKIHDNLLVKYTSDFRGDYGWIDKLVLSDRKFKKLAEYVGIDGYYPFYNMSSDSVHGGAAGFYRMGLMDSRQDKVFLVGPSVYGLADAIQNTAYCLNLINASLLNLHSDLENLIQLGLLDRFFRNIGRIAVNTQKKLESESIK